MQTGVSAYDRAILDAIPSPVLVVEEDIRIVDFNSAAESILSGGGGTILHRRAGDVMQCIHAAETEYGCGGAAACQDCVVRNSAGLALKGGRVVRRKTHMRMISKTGDIEAYMLVTAASFIDSEGTLKAIVILEDISDLVALRRILPICSHCKKIRDDKEYWLNVEAYFKSTMDIDFSHGICPDCARQYYPEYYAAKMKAKLE